MDRLTEQYHDDRRFNNILLRIRNFIRKLSRFLKPDSGQQKHVITVFSGENGDVTDENPGGNMKKIIYSGISLLFGQIRNVLGRQQDFTTTNAVHLLITLRAVFKTILHYNNKQPKESQMSIKRLVMEFIRVLWHKFVEFLKTTALGQWMVHYVWRQLTFTRGNAAKFAAFGAALYLCWRYWDKHNDALNF